MTSTPIRRVFFPFTILWITLLLLHACSPAKLVPEGSYLLDRVEVKSDAKEISKSDLNDYVRQNPNSYVLGMFRMQLGIYNLSGNDSTRWWNRFLRRIGQAPVISCFRQWDTL